MIQLLLHSAAAATTQLAPHPFSPSAPLQGIEGASYYDGVLSNISRNGNGSYVATTNRGNFYLTWVPGSYCWEPHNRPAGRRLQNLGWTPEGRLWASTRGGDVYLAAEEGVTESFDKSKLASRGYGILDGG